MEPMNIERIEAALKVLQEEGLKGIKPEYQQDIPQFRAVGLAIAHSRDNAQNVLDLAYSALEDWNYHDLCAVIEWVHPLYNQTFHLSDLQRLENKVNKKGVTVLTEWDPARKDYNKKTVNVRVVIESTESQP